MPFQEGANGLIADLIDWPGNAWLDHLQLWSADPLLVLYAIARAFSGTILFSAFDQFDDFQASGGDSQEN